MSAGLFVLNRLIKIELHEITQRSLFHFCLAIALHCNKNALFLAECLFFEDYFSKFLMEINFH